MRPSLAVVLALSFAANLAAQAPPAPAPSTTAGLPATRRAILESVRQARKDNLDRGLIAARFRAASFLLAAEVAELRAAITETEQQRIDKQPGATANASGSSSLVERGVVPFLLGLAVENGNVARSVDGTSFTFRTRPAALAGFLATQDYLAAAATGNSSFWLAALSRASLQVTFDAARGNETNAVFTGARNQVTGYGFRLDLWNSRDPRDPKYWKGWIALRDVQGAEAAQALTNLHFILAGDPAFNAWAESAAAAVLRAAEAEVDAEVERQLAGFAATRLPALSEEFKRASRAAAEVWNRFAAGRLNLIENALTAPALSVEYVLTRQNPAVTAAANNGTGVSSSPNSPATAAAASLPSLGTLRVIGAWPLGRGADATVNASLTNFNNTFRSDRIRDYRVGFELNAPVAEIRGWGKSSFALSALYLHLRNQPLGEPVKINNRDLDSTGNIWFAQAKFELPFGTSGIRIPFALTYASRHELLADERNRFGLNIGLTFDLDKLAAGTK